MIKHADLSPCGLYRYTLWRVWDTSLPICTWVCLNPSKADHLVDDPSAVRMMGFARSWGYGGMLVLNAYAWRSTDPRELWSAPDPVGPMNDAILSTFGHGAVCGWGNNIKPERARQVRGMLSGLRALRITGQGHPSHPLYLPANLQPLPLI